MNNEIPLTDQVVLVTGATAGIGLTTARAIARLGATVVLTGRDEDKSRAAVDAIRRESGNDRVDYLLADLSSIQQTRRLAETFTARYDRLQVLVNNVGAIYLTRSETVDGIENTFALNHLVGYFLLTDLLRDVLVASRPARIVNVSSGVHTYGKMNFHDLEGRRKYSALGAYAQSKLANVLFSYDLARQLEGQGVTVNALHPGAVASNFGLTNNSPSALFRVGRRLSNLFSVSVEKGAETSVYLATSPEVADASGLYFEKKRAKRSAPASYSRETQERLRLISEEMLAGRAPDLGRVPRHNLPEAASPTTQAPVSVG